MKIKCLKCNEIIESKHRHNLVSCKCANCYIDGGQDYLHFGGNDSSKILIIFDDGTEVLASDEENYKRKYDEWENNKYRNFSKIPLNQKIEEKANYKLKVQF